LIFDVKHQIYTSAHVDTDITIGMHIFGDDIITAQLFKQVQIMQHKHQTASAKSLRMFFIKRCSGTFQIQRLAISITLVISA
jgi:hypothetical protein